MMSVDAILATKLNDDLKTCASGFARSATETTNPELRRAFAEASQKAIQSQEQLFRLMEKKGWYTAPAARDEDIQQVLPQLQVLQSDTLVGV